jgi:hypothetical protein
MNRPEFDLVKVEEFQDLCAVFEVSRQSVECEAQEDFERSLPCG